MNDLFGAESFAESQIRELVQGLVQRLLADPDLVNQTHVNSKKQFVESQDFQSAVNEAIADNQEAHNTMADYFFTDGACDQRDHRRARRRVLRGRDRQWGRSALLTILRYSS
jgi:3-deoxy-D-arabino-heptulosonate 7-phosphate (DAHP) synthase